MKTFNTLRVIFALVGVGMLVGAFSLSRALPRFLKPRQPNRVL